jgi:peptide/nickel transport system permease protein
MMTDPLNESPVKHPETTFLCWRYAPAEHKMLHSFLNSKMNLIASVLLLLLLAAALCAPWITPVDPTEVSLTARLTPPIWYSNGQSPHLLGTDNLGRDVYSVIIYGLRISLMVGILSVLLAATIGVSLGLIAGYARGFWESLVMRAVDIQLSLPIMVALCIMVIFGRGVDKIIIVLSITGWARYARIVRGTVLSIREKEYVEAAHALGLSPLTIMVKYLLINSITPVIILCAVEIPHVILMESTLSFLGLGVPITTPSLGLAIARGYHVMFSGSWWASMFPGLALVLVVASINVIADWLRDALDPRSREGV